MATHTGPSGIPGTPGTPRVLRAMNDRAALDLLVAHGPLTRTRISELTGLSKPTASQLLGRLEETGLVRSRSKESGRPGPNALLYEIEPTAAHVAALSADPHGISAVVADITGTVVGRARVEADSVAEDVRHRTAQLVKEAVDGALRGPDSAPPSRTPRSSARRGPSTRGRANCATPHICPAGTPAPSAPSWPRCSAPR